MLPNAEGCGTGLQLSAKEVVLGRPDMIRSSGYLGADRGCLDGRVGGRTDPSHPKGSQFLNYTQFKKGKKKESSVIRWRFGL
jgi:hypothetical protein